MLLLNFQKRRIGGEIVEKQLNFEFLTPKRKAFEQWKIWPPYALTSVKWGKSYWFPPGIDSSDVDVDEFV